MKRAVIAMTLLLCLAASGALAADLTPQTAAFLREIGIDPASPKITAIADDKVGTYSIADLASRRNEEGVKAFIATRTFIHAFMRDPKTDFPDDDLYVIRYLTDDEKALVAKELTLELSPKKP